MTVITKKNLKKPTKKQLEEAYKPWDMGTKKATVKKSKRK